MTVRRIVSAVLVAFALVSLALAVWGEVRAKPRADAQAAAIGAAPGEDKTVVYYLHGTFRCPACNTVEAVGEEIVKTEFADAVAAGAMEWRPVNYQENDLLAERYKVSGNMIVVARFEDGREVETRRLDRVMELSGDRQELAEYIRAGIRSGEASGRGPMVLWAALAAAFGLGLLTAISPCPMATNIAAVSFLSRGAGHPRKVLLSGLTYTLGRTVVYVGLGVLILVVLRMSWAGGGDGAAGASVSRFLQKYGGMVLGPALIVAGLLLAGFLTVSASLNLGGQGLQQRASAGGAKWAFVLGVLFALSFCPISATIFFGSMVTLSTQNRSPVLLPAAFGVATALPVIVFAFLVAFAGRLVGGAFNRMTQIDRWLRRITGVVFIVAGIYYALMHVRGVLG